jgi:hypothetical protein
MQAALEIRSGDIEQEVSILKGLLRHPNLPIFHGISKTPVSGMRAAWAGNVCCAHN